MAKAKATKLTEDLAKKWLSLNEQRKQLNAEADAVKKQQRALEEQIRLEIGDSKYTETINYCIMQSIKGRASYVCPESSWIEFKVEPLTRD